MKLYIRADGGQTVGLGHLVRCIALAQMLMKDFEIGFVCKSIPPQIAVDIASLGFGLIEIKEEHDFLDRLQPRDVVVLDSYELGVEYQKDVKAKGCKLVCIDDINQQTFFSDLVINHSPNISAADYDAQLYTQFALGLPYVLLRPNFLAAAKQAKSISAIKKVFVCFGGADPKNLTQRIVDVLKKDQRFEDIWIVTGAAYTHLDELRQSIAKDGRFQLFHAIDADEICGMMQQSQLSIVPASGILQEVIAAGNRVISGIYIDNQKNIFQKYKEMQAFESAEDFSTEHVQHAINKSFENEHLPIRTFIDGKSGERLLKLFNQLVKEDELTLRLAIETDVQKTFEWATNKIIRAFSFNTTEIKFSEHSNWFINKVNSNQCYYFIATIGQTCVGSIRFDLKDDIALISYLLDPAYHNQGLGIVLLKKGVEKLLSINRKVKKVTGYVIPQNISSIKAFERLGYMQLIEDGNFKFEKRIVS